MKFFNLEGDMIEADAKSGFPKLVVVEALGLLDWP